MANIDDQPVSNVQWLQRDQLHANDYNPNRVAPMELDLLATSIWEDGWTQPIVARRYEGVGLQIVDGYHRWTVAGRPNISALTNGLVPVVLLPDALNRAHQMMSTIRHNRARGTHYVVRMADIVNELAIALSVPTSEIMQRLGMESEEVKRLIERGSMTTRHGQESFNKGWVPGDS